MFHVAMSKANSRGDSGEKGKACEKASRGKQVWHCSETSIGGYLQYSTC